MYHQRGMSAVFPSLKQALPATVNRERLGLIERGLDVERDQAPGGRG